MRGMGRTSPSRTVAKLFQRHPHLCSHRTNVTLTSFATRQCQPRTSPSRLRGTVIGSIATVDPATTSFVGKALGRRLGCSPAVSGSWTPPETAHTRAVEAPRPGRHASPSRASVRCRLSSHSGRLWRTAGPRTRRQSTGDHVWTLAPELIASVRSASLTGAAPRRASSPPWRRQNHNSRQLRQTGTKLSTHLHHLMRTSPSPVARL